MWLFLHEVEPYMPVFSLLRLLLVGLLLGTSLLPALESGSCRNPADCGLGGNDSQRSYGYVFAQRGDAANLGIGSEHPDR